MSSLKKEVQDAFAIHTSLQALMTWRYPFAHPVPPFLSAVVAASPAQREALEALDVEVEMADEDVLTSLLLQLKHLF